jgi:hypothetical protein
MADKQTFKDLLEDEIKDLYSAEKQLTKAIPKMAKGSHDAALSTAFMKHLKETEEQVARLEEVGKLVDVKPAGKKCQGMEGVIKEGAEALEERKHKETRASRTERRPNAIGNRDEALRQRQGTGGPRNSPSEERRERVPRPFNS